MSQHAGTEAIVPILCRFWLEDGVWNGIAEDTAVAVFGKSFEEAMCNLREAIKNHLQAAIETGEINVLLEHLRERAKEYGFLSPEQIPPSSPIVKMLVAVKDQQLVSVT